MLWDDLREELNKIKDKNLFRTLKMRGEVGKDFRSNNYLGLSRHPEVIESAREAVSEFGCGAEASRLVGGTLKLHLDLECEIAKFKGTESALVFPSGFQTNLGIISALLDNRDFIVADHLSHASLIDAARLSSASFRTYPHLKLDHLESILSKEVSRRARRRFVLTDGLFSMDGDIPDLSLLLKVIERFDAYLIIDDAHGTGTIGKTGRGIFEHFGLAPSERTIIMGTLSKALGSQGGFIAGEKILIDYLINCCRSFIYTTGLSPASAAGALTALRIINREPQRVLRLQQNSLTLRTLLGEKFNIQTHPPTPIIPVIFGAEECALNAAHSLEEKGFNVIAIRPPTVKPNSSRLRICVSSEHTQADIEALARAIVTLIPH